MQQSTMYSTTTTTFAIICSTSSSSSRARGFVDRMDRVHDTGECCCCFAASVAIAPPRTKEHTQMETLFPIFHTHFMPSVNHSSTQRKVRRNNINHIVNARTQFRLNEKSFLFIVVINSSELMSKRIFNHSATSPSRHTTVNLLSLASAQVSFIF